MGKLGRDASGRWVRDDAVIKEALGGLAFAIRALSEAVREPAMDAAARQRLAQDADAFAAGVLDALPQLDVGTRPTREPDIMQTTTKRFSTMTEDA